MRLLQVPRATHGNGSEMGLDVIASNVGLDFFMLRHMQAQRKMLAQRDTLQQTQTTTKISNSNNYGSRPGSNGDLSSAERDSR